ncbi:MAG TPA: alcohol dehydrogenase catalytic domain-containing protein [Planctomycetota bacterium]|nr:alcohol dehydrogenase catalytic domain-containing protein [Planctomycetota bacterium]
MNALIYRGPGDIRLEQVPEPACGEAEIRVKVDACAVCGTDLKSFLHGNPKITPPRIIGHEFTGIVDTIGSKTGGFAVGDRIVMATSVSCGACAYCQRGWTNLCVDMAAMGFKYEGGMAEYVVVPERALRNGHAVKVPKTVKPEHAALAEPLSCCVNAAENCGIQKGDTVAVVGAGPMGIMNACIAREFGAARIILAEINEARLRQAEAFGFDRLVNPAAEDLAKVVKDMTGGLGADVCIVAAPAAKPQEQAIGLVRKRGVVCLFASLPAGGSLLSIDSRPLHYNELKMVGTSDSTPSQVQRAVALIAGGSVPMDKLATHVLPLADFERAFALMQSGESLRVVLTP